MARIHPAYPIDDGSLEGMSSDEQRDQQAAAILAHRPALAQALFEMEEAFTASSGTLSVRLTELLRLRVAFHNQCRSCMSVRYAPDETPEGLVCSLERPEEADDLTDAEKAALRFADLMATNHLAIDDAVFDDLRRYYTEGELVELSIYCAKWVGFGRMAATWSMVDYLEPRYRESTGVHTPWVPAGSAV
jgi:alkylhydroperoxidase family enzyme